MKTVAQKRPAHSPVDYRENHNARPLPGNYEPSSHPNTWTRNEPKEEELFQMNLTEKSKKAQVMQKVEPRERSKFGALPQLK